MLYSVELLTTPAECDAALAVARERKRVLLKRGQDASYQRENSTTSAAALISELKGLGKEIDFLTPYVATLEPGDERTKREKELRLATDRRDELLSRQEASGSVALLTRELEEGETTGRLNEVEAFSTAVQNRKTALLAQA